jgi:hypothetical protein
MTETFRPLETGKTRAILLAISKLGCNGWLCTLATADRKNKLWQIMV